MRTFRGSYLGAALKERGLSQENRPEASKTKRRIKNSKRYKEDEAQQAVAVSPSEELKMAGVGVENIKDCVCQMIHIINCAMGSRGRSPQTATNGDFELEDKRRVFGVWCPRLSYDARTDKTHQSRYAVKNSEAGTLEKIIECVCEGGHKSDDVICFMTVPLKYQEYKKAVQESFQRDKFTGGNEDEVKTLWKAQPFFTRLLFGKNLSCLQECLKHKVWAKKL